MDLHRLLRPEQRDGQDLFQLSQAKEEQDQSLEGSGATVAVSLGGGLLRSRRPRRSSASDEEREYAVEEWGSLAFVADPSLVGSTCSPRGRFIFTMYCLEVIGLIMLMVRVGSPTACGRNHLGGVR